MDRWMVVSWLTTRDLTLRLTQHTTMVSPLGLLLPLLLDARGTQVLLGL